VLGDADCIFISFPATCPINPWLGRLSRRQCVHVFISAGHELKDSSSSWANLQTSASHKQENFKRYSNSTLWTSSWPCGKVQFFTLCVPGWGKGFGEWFARETRAKSGSGDRDFLHCEM